MFCKGQAAPLVFCYVYNECIPSFFFYSDIEGPERDISVSEYIAGTHTDCGASFGSCAERFDETQLRLCFVTYTVSVILLFFFYSDIKGPEREISFSEYVRRGFAG